MARFDHKAEYVLVSKRFVRSSIIAYLILFILVIASFQYTNYVERRSNRIWCGVVVLFDDTYKKSPPPTEVGKLLAPQFARMVDSFRCK